ncbi:hypothetical protein SCHPADRAFT_909921 [Schizopora paradoxa]|uniref:Uncharacterized protein n=1 Tax=Schizopora paradoxa TaxID=27342 RepID=A0A0H2R538_9AGAM|nr:hypothetical protein SCHPADRAFT_909921 [Schizopora paradoxa]
MRRNTISSKTQTDHAPIRIDVRTESQVVTDSGASPYTSSVSPLLPREVQWLSQSEEYSYASTWSTNYTVSNLTGPGRIIGNALSSAGSSLERQLGTMAYRAGLGRYARAETSLQRTGPSSLFIYEDTDEKSRERVCKTLLEYASSTNLIIQLMAFRRIVYNAILYPPLRSAINNHRKKRGETPGLLTFSWKRPGVDYSSLWLYHYQLVSICLSPDSPIMDSISNLECRIEDTDRILHFSHFIGVLRSCRSVPDSMLAIEFMDRFWSGGGLEEYIKQNGFKDPILFNFATTLLKRYEFALSNNGSTTLPRECGNQCAF